MTGMALTAKMEQAENSDGELPEDPVAFAGRLN